MCATVVVWEVLILSLHANPKWSTTVGLLVVRQSSDLPRWVVSPLHDGGVEEHRRSDDIITLALCHGVLAQACIHL